MSEGTTGQKGRAWTKWRLDDRTSDGAGVEARFRGGKPSARFSAKLGRSGLQLSIEPRNHSTVRASRAGVADMLKFGFPLVYVAVAMSAARADTMVCTTDAGVTHCEAPLRHYRVTGTREGNRTYFEDNKGRRWMMIEETGRTTIIPR